MRRQYECPKCNAEGILVEYQSDPLFEAVTSSTSRCDLCNGKGLLKDKLVMRSASCRTCKGSQRISCVDDGCDHCDFLRRMVIRCPWAREYKRPHRDWCEECIDGRVFKYFKVSHKKIKGYRK